MDSQSKIRVHGLPFNAEREVRGLELVMAESGVADVIIAEIEGDISVERLRDSARRLQAKHPGLRAYVDRRSGQRPKFRYCDPSVASFTLEEIRESTGAGASALWQRVAAREAAHRFELTAPNGLRVSLVRSGARRQHVILNAPHALVDGVSLFRLMHDLLSGLAQSQSEHEPGLAPTPAILTQLPLRRLERAAAWIGRPLAVLQQRCFAARTSFPIKPERPDLSALHSQCRFYEGSKTAWTASTVQRKKWDVTVGGLYSAVVALSALRYLERTQGGWVHRKSYDLPISMDFSLRAALPEASVTQQAVGLFTGVADIGVRIEPGFTIWELARALKQRSVVQSERRMPLLYHGVLDRFYEVDCDPSAYGIDYSQSGGAGDAINISNVGRYPFPIRHPGFCMRNIYGLNGPIAGGPMFIFWLRSIDGHFCYNSTALSECVEAASAQRFFADVVALMEASGSALLGQSLQSLLRTAHQPIPIAPLALPARSAAERAHQPASL